MSDIKGKFSKFKSQYDKPCAHCGRDLKKGDVVYGTKEKPFSPKGRWFIVCPECYTKLEAEKEPPEAIAGDEYHLGEGGDTARPSETESTDLLREFIALEAEKEQALAREIERKKQEEEEAAMQAQQEFEARKSIPWTTEWLWENAEWRWNRGGRTAREA